MVKKISLLRISLETISELLTIFVAAAAGVVIGQKGYLILQEWIVAGFLIIISIFLKKIAQLK